MVRSTETPGLARGLVLLTCGFGFTGGLLALPGHPGGAASQAVKEVERQVIGTCLSAGIPVRAEIASVEAAEQYLKLGVRHFSLFNDVSVIYDAWRTGGEQLRDLVGQG